MRGKLIALILFAAVIAAAVIAWKPLKAVYFSGVPNKLRREYLYIPTGATFEQVVDSLMQGGFLTDRESFLWVAEKMKYRRPQMRPGRFKIEPGWSNRRLIQHLRAGPQAPIRFVLNVERLPEDIAALAGKYFELDSAAFAAAFSDAALLAEFGYTPQTLMALFIPNTYEMFWNTTPRAFLERMAKENKIFWSKNDRLQKAQTLGFSPIEVYTLASIVERETNDKNERPTIAGVYLNRLRVGMPLQADPTCVFATRDFTVKRVTQYHTTFDSPYNTYLYKGLPPGPISMASISSIDAVLNPEKHNYFFFCARPDDSGTHVFAATYAAHLVNARRFQDWLSRQARE
ncbi:MAG: endolytic transglycosylase MltG [Saprospiraceae bacterium]|nr:endolytic transglycosylase MltG [Saprospiraceae bacterium]MDW8484978.1 endolytic transglycosylase MltG [Saprospiraceae bacterium]